MKCQDPTDNKPWFSATIIWPCGNDEGKPIEATLPDSDEIITGTLILADMMSDEGELPKPVTAPHWVIVNEQGETDFHDVCCWRLK